MNDESVSKHIYLTIAEVFATVPGCEHDFVEKVAKNMQPELREHFLRRPKCYVSDFLWMSRIGEVCRLFAHNWIGESYAVEQLLKAGFSPLDARRVAMESPVDADTMSREQATVVTSLMEGLMLREEEELEPKQPREKSNDADLSVSDVAKILRVSRSSVVSNIVAGKLRGYRADAPGSKRATWRVSRAALEEFQRPAPVQKQEQVARRKTASKSDVIEFY